MNINELRAYYDNHCTAAEMRAADGEDVHVVLVCPCCASPVDAEPDPCPQAFTCDVCEQSWTMAVDLHRCQQNSLA